MSQRVGSISPACRGAEVGRFKPEHGRSLDAALVSTNAILARVRELAQATLRRARCYRQRPSRLRSASMTTPHPAMSPGIRSTAACSQAAARYVRSARQTNISKENGCFAFIAEPPQDGAQKAARAGAPALVAAEMARRGTPWHPSPLARQPFQAPTSDPRTRRRTFQTRRWYSVSPRWCISLRRGSAS